MTPTPEDIERVARAICRAYCGPTMSVEAIECQVEGAWDMWTLEAKGAIAAMPSDDWRPIATEPPTRSNDDIIVARFSGQQLLNLAASTGYVIGTVWDGFEATHWRPLPSPPKGPV